MRNPMFDNLLKEVAGMAGLDLSKKEKGLCVKCGQDALSRCTTNAGRKDVSIHGICEVCYDTMWDEPGGSIEEDLVRNQQKGESDV
jgi:hypothetical protein